MIDNPRARPGAAGDGEHARHRGPLAARLPVLSAYLFPPVPDIVTRTLGILFSWPLLSQVLVTALRIFAGLVGAFVLGCVMALAIGRSPRIESYVTPVLVLLQGIPALSWVVIAVIWFHGIEFRIFFIMVVTTLAGLHLPDPRRRPLDVEGPVRDDHVVPAARAGPCSAC